MNVSIDFLGKYLRFVSMPVSADKQGLISFRVPPSGQRSITRRHSNRNFPGKWTKDKIKKVFSKRGAAAQIIGEIDIQLNLLINYI